MTDRRAWWNILSWGVQFFDVHNKERIEWSAPDRVSSQLVKGSCLDFSEHCIAFHIVALNFSHCPLPLGLKLVVRLVATPCECNQDFSYYNSTKRSVINAHVATATRSNHCRTFDLSYLRNLSTFWRLSTLFTGFPLCLGRVSNFYELYFELCVALAPFVFKSWSVLTTPHAHCILKAKTFSMFQPAAQPITATGCSP